jgi:hypothetical protein
MKTILHPDQTIKSFGCKVAHWKTYSKLDQVLVGHFCKFLIDSLAFESVK